MCFWDIASCRRWCEWERERCRVSEQKRKMAVDEGKGKNPRVCGQELRYVEEVTRALANRRDEQRNRGMYSLKPIIALPQQIPLPKVMYELPRIQGASSAPSSGDIVAGIERQVKRLSKTPLPEYNILERRQMKILEQLGELKEQIEGLCVALRLNDASKIPQPGACANQESVHAELILYANPSSPPYSLIALQKLWKDTKFNIQVYRHSSVSNADTRTFEDKLLATMNCSAIHTIDLKLIWKDVGDVQLVTKVYDYPLEGEANVLRYLTRLIASHKYEDTRLLVQSSTIDSILDLCLRLGHEEPRNVNAITPKFANLLGKGSWFLNSIEASVVDAIVWSTIKRVLQDRVPRELKSWHESCDKSFLSA